jgi:hypothetical protein
MKAHTDYDGLEQLPDLVHKQRRLVAGKMRIQNEERALNEQIDALLSAAGVEVVRCETSLGPFEVRRAVARTTGMRYASVTPIKADVQQ